MKFETIPRTGVEGAAIRPPGVGGEAMEDEDDAGGGRSDASILDGAGVGGWGGVEGGVSMILLFSITPWMLYYYYLARLDLPPFGHPPFFLLG